MSQRRPGHSRRQASVDQPRYAPPAPATATSQIPVDQPYPHIPQASDYESDNVNYRLDAPSPPPPQSRTNDELNLSVLRRHHPDISAILSIAPYAVLYEFHPHPEPSWNKSGVEGSLFVCQLTPGAQLHEDRYTALVLNRRGLENFEAELREGDNSGIEITEEYVIVSLEREGVQKIYGIFIFSEGPGSSTEQTRALNADLMKRCAVQAGLSLKHAEAAAAEALPLPRNGHVRGRGPSAEETGGRMPVERQESLQELFGRQRAEDASWSVRVHSPEGRSQQLLRSRRAPSGPRVVEPPQSRDVLGDLFRNAGLGLRS